MTHLTLRNTLGVGVGLALLTFVFAVAALPTIGIPLDWEVVLTFLGSAIAVIVSFVFFKQKQDLEELRLFKELFAEFNKRYDTLNDGLVRINAPNESEEFSIADKKLLFDYFNLCGEEYLYFQKGYIFPEVWMAWCNGMKYYLENRRIRALWQEEELSNSYYGLTMAKIHQYASARELKPRTDG